MQSKSKVQKNQMGKKSQSKGQASQKKRAPSSKMEKNRSNAIQRSVAAAYSTGNSQNGPKIVRQRDGSIRIVHRELVANVIGNPLYSVQVAYPLNPGLSSSFPWLSSISSSFEKYKFHKLEYEYMTRTGSATAGSVMLIPDYDSSDASPLSEQIASTYQDMVEDAPWKDIRCRLRQQRLNGTVPQKFVRNSAIGANSDIKLYDSGILSVATVDASTTLVPFGKLWVCYDVELFIPQLPPNGLPILMGSAAISGGTVGVTIPLGSSPSIDSQTVGVTYSGTTTGIITFEPGDWLAVWRVIGTGFVGNPISFGDTGISLLAAEVTNATSISTVVWRFRASAGVGLNPSLSLDYTSVGGATVTSARFYAARVPLNALF